MTTSLRMTAVVLMNLLSGQARRAWLDRQKTYTYPSNAEVGDALGRSDRSGVDLEGRPLVAEYVVGRAPGRSGDQSISSEALAEIVARQSREGISVVESGGLPRGTVGQARFSETSKQPLGIDVASGLEPGDYANVIRHEAGHLIDEVAGQIPTDELSRELQRLYHYGVEGQDRQRNLTLPTHLGYRAEEAPREYMAEAIRQYLSAPDAMKERAPQTAARIRNFVNDNPRLRDLTQFNMLPAGVAVGIGGANALAQTQERGGA